MKAKNQGQLKTENQLLKRKVSELEKKAEEAYRTSPEWQLIKEMQEEKASRRQLAEICKYYREQLGECQIKIDGLGEDLFRKAEECEAVTDERDELLVDLSEEQGHTAALRKQLYDEERKFLVFISIGGTAILAAYVVEGLRLFGVL